MGIYFGCFGRKCLLSICNKTKKNKQKKPATTVTAVVSTIPSQVELTVFPEVKEIENAATKR
jgi:hypothetical protein